MSPNVDIRQEIDDFVSRVKESVQKNPPIVLGVSAFAAGVVSIAVGRKVYIRNFRRIQNGDWITPDVFAKKKWIKGVVTTVGDADNFRLYHTPGFGWRWPLKFRRIPSTTKGLQGQTLHIRIAGVDAPEAAHFGRPAQPYSEEALAWLKNKVLGRRVYCQLLRRDQYSRTVANVTTPPRFLPAVLFPGKSLSLDMLKSGWVTTYEQAGAEYGKYSKEEFLKVEAEAKAARKGMWAKGANAESPAEYKRRHAQAESTGKPTKEPAAKNAKAKSSGWFSRLFSK